MRQIQNYNLAQLLTQLRFTPQKQRCKQLESAEKLFVIIDKDKEYPLEFVIFHITGFHPKNLSVQRLIKGDELAEDLRIFISKLSAQLALPAGEQKQKIYTIEELAKELDVSTKTINRWRKIGLLARKFVFDDGKKRLGFLQSFVDTFLKANPQLVTNAKVFTRLINKERKLVIKKAAELTSKTSLSRYQIIEKIAVQLGKAHETVRYTILKYDKANPDKRIFEGPPGVISPHDAGELYRMFKQGSRVTQLMKLFSRTKSSIYRIVNRQRARELLAKKIEFIASDEFLDKDAKAKILAEPIEQYKVTFDKTAEPFSLDGSLTEYFQSLKDMPLLDRDSEIRLFRRYNYLKYLVCERRKDIKLVQVSGELLNEIEGYLAEAEIIKKRIIEANLRLVVSIANKHSAQRARLPDLVSEGNVSLMRAVEKFDCTRGVRFATYASWAIAKDYARKIPAEASRPDKTSEVSLKDIHRDLRAAQTADIGAVERASRSLAEVIKNNLDKREQYIILNHFGLVGSLLKKNKKTLQQIGQDLNLSRERVRQIELAALQKLRHSLSMEEFELLTG